MYVCICNEVTDRDIQKAVIAGASSMRQLRDQLRVATRCGKCSSFARECMNQVLAQPKPQTQTVRT
jgi:bacterioferritin-associated ferredoxin